MLQKSCSSRSRFLARALRIGETRHRPLYPREARERGRWPLTNPVPVRDLRAARTLIADGKRIVAERRASKLLGELGG